MKLNSLYVALVGAISTSAFAAPTDLERIEVKGSYFNDYKVDNANGAMRTSASLLETAQSVTVISDQELAWPDIPAGFRTASHSVSRNSPLSGGCQSVPVSVDRFQ